jgi:hypothetical protein
MTDTRGKTILSKRMTVMSQGSFEDASRERMEKSREAITATPLEDVGFEHQRHRTAED